jgi:YbbR domain-containing protein
VIDILFSFTFFLSPFAFYPNKMAIIKLSAIERKRVSAFVTCLVLATLAWLFTVLSSPSPYTVKEILTFKNTPQKRAFRSLQSDTVSVTINGTGWDMLFSKMSLENKNISVDLHTLEDKNFIILSSQLDHINASKDISKTITSFYPDTLYFDFSNRKEKRVPVHLVSSIKYDHQYYQAGNISIKPSYVVINGPANVIDKITQWDTDTLKVDSVDETISTQIGLQSSIEGNVSIYPKRVGIVVPVEEFTEKSISIPVKLINNNFNEVKVFPQHVKITFITSLSKYADMDEDLFEATADLNLWRNSGYKVLPVTISKIPAFCKMVSITPAYIDFIIKDNAKNWNNR